MAAVTNVTYNHIEWLLEQLLKENRITFAEYNVIHGACEYVYNKKPDQFTTQHGITALEDLGKLFIDLKTT
jgi:hypothetical protein